VEAEDAAVGLLRELAATGLRLDDAYGEITSRANGGESAFRHLSVRETAEGLWIAAALVLRRGDGREVEWTLSASNALDGSGWRVEREVLLNESPVGEPVVLASTELPVAEFATSSALSGALPTLTAELLDLSAPELARP